MHDPTNAREHGRPIFPGHRTHEGGRNPGTIRLLLTLEDAIGVLHGHRSEILFVLAVHSSLTVTALANLLVLDKGTVSHELGRLMQSGLVRWARVGTSHFYRLTERVTSFMEEGMVQIEIRTESGDWIWMHRDYAGKSKRVVMPPQGFLDGSKASQALPAVPSLPDANLREETRSPVDASPQEPLRPRATVTEPLAPTESDPTKTRSKRKRR